MRLSYSSISAYQKCPLSYKFQYVDKRPTKKTSALSFGGSVHGALEFMYNVQTPDPPALAEVLNALTENWMSEGYLDEVDERNHFDHARRILEGFYVANIGDFRVPVALEHRFSINVDGVNLTGVLDRMDKLPSGGYEIIDYKTSKRLPPKARVDDDLQLSIYHLAVEEIWGFPPEKLSLYFVLPNQKLSSSRTPGQIGETKETILSVADGIERDDFPAIENPLCPWCDFQRLCPYFEHMYGAAENSTEEELDIRRLVDDYIEIDARMSIDKAEKDRLKERIIKYCEENDFARVFGSMGSLTRSDYKRYSYDADKLKELLAPAGLWESVLSVDSKLLGSILASPEVSKELKRNIEELKTIENVSRSLRVKRGAKALIEDTEG